MYEWCRIFKGRLLLSKVLNPPSAFSCDTSSVVTNRAESEGFSENRSRVTALKQRPKHHFVVVFVLNGTHQSINGHIFQNRGTVTVQARESWHLFPSSGQLIASELWASLIAVS